MGEDYCGYSDRQEAGIVDYQEFIHTGFVRSGFFKSFLHGRTQDIAGIENFCDNSRFSRGLWRARTASPGVRVGADRRAGDGLGSVAVSVDAAAR